jgi:hypothetical protein
MKVFYCAAVCFLFCGVAVGQEFFTVLPDTRFPVVLHGTIRASQAKVGDPVEFRTIEPVLIGNGIVVPENAEILGTVVFVRTDPNATPSSWVRIRVQELWWKTGQASLNAVVDGVHFVRSSYFATFHHQPATTFLEGTHVEPHLFRNASTDFFSDSKPVVLHNGIILEIRHVVPKDNENEQPLTASTSVGKP